MSAQSTPSWTVLATLPDDNAGTIVRAERRRFGDVDGVLSICDHPARDENRGASRSFEFHSAASTVIRLSSDDRESRIAYVGFFRTQAFW